MKHTKLFNNKRGVNDISILAGIIAVFLLTALIIPFINSSYGTSYTVYDVDGQIVEQSRIDADAVSRLSAFGVLLTVIKLAIWDVGNTLSLPWWIDAFFSLLSVIMILVIARNIWIGGGG